MSYYNQDEGVCFDFSITLTPKSAGDYGCVRMGGMSRTIKECLSQANEICDEIERHVGGVDHLEITLQDESGRYADITEWEANKIIGNEWNPKWEDYKDKLPLVKPSYKDKYFVLERFCKELMNNSYFQTNNPSEADYLEEQFKEWDDE